MQNFQIRLFTGAYHNAQKTEKRTTVLAVFLLLVQLVLLAYLVLTKGFAMAFVGIYLLHVLVLSFLVARIWLDSRPEHQQHLTLTSQGVRYRTGSTNKEQEFDWEEVDEMHLQLFSVEFILKNDERHLVQLDHINSDALLKQAKQQLKMIASQKGITLNYSQS